MNCYLEVPRIFMAVEYLTRLLEVNNAIYRTCNIIVDFYSVSTDICFSKILNLDSYASLRNLQQSYIKSDSGCFRLEICFPSKADRSR